MLSWGKTVLERKKLECKSFLSYVFKDISFPPECDDSVGKAARHVDSFCFIKERRLRKMFSLTDG